jgi:arsenite-transporting ATPase
MNNDHRIVIFTGKGGVGKTVTACATAVHLARQGNRTLLVTTDRQLTLLMFWIMKWVTMFRK